MLTENAANLILERAQNMAHAAEFIHEILGGRASHDIDAEDLDLLRNLTHTIRTDLAQVEVRILNTGSAPDASPHYLSVDAPRTVSPGELDHNAS